MVAQGGSSPPRPGNEADVSQQRKSLMAAAIRRGEVKISEPILWVEGVPGTPQSVSAVVEQPATPPEAMGVGNPKEIQGLALSTDEAAPAVHEPQDYSPPQEPRKSTSYGAIGSIGSHATVVPVTPTAERKQSIFVEADMASPSPSAGERKKARRSGTLRTVLRSVFGRSKKKRQSKELTPPPSRSGVKHEYSRSEPITASRMKQSPIAEHARAFSAQTAVPTILESETSGRQSRVESRQTPVQHMLPFPMNINAPQPESPDTAKKPGNYLSFETSPLVHRRRATLPSMILSAEDSTTVHKMWSTTDLTPLGSTSETSPLGSLGIPSPPIDNAFATATAQSNRRSRSAGALHDLAKRQEYLSQLRDRTAEINYWRANQPHAPQDTEQRQSLSNQSTPIASPRASSTGMAMTEVSEALAETGSSVDDGDVGSPGFDPILAEQAEPEEPPEGSMAARLAQLENTMHRLSMSFQEYSTKEDKPTGQRDFALRSAPKSLTPQIAFAPPTPSRQASTGHIHVTEAPHQNPSMRFTQPMRTIPSPSPSKGSNLSSTSTAAAPTSPQSTYPQPNLHLPPAPSSVQSAPQTFSSTIGGANSPYLTQASLQEHITPLYNALRYERQIRKALETQVSHLQKDVMELSNMVAQMRKEAAYMSQATIHAGSRSQRGSPVKGFANPYLSGITNGERSRFSGYDSTDDDTDADVDMPLRSPQETWTTPREEQSTQWGSSVDTGMF